MEKTQKYKCLLCGEIVIPNEDGTCPICGAPFDQLVKVDDEGNEIA